MTNYNSTTMKTKPTKPTKRIALNDLPGCVIIQTANIDHQTLAWWTQDDRYLVALDGIDQNENACKAWFSTWFDVQDDQQIKVERATNHLGALFLVAIRQA